MNAVTRLPIAISIKNCSVTHVTSKGILSFTGWLRIRPVRCNEGSWRMYAGIHVVFEIAYRREWRTTSR